MFLTQEQNQLQKCPWTYIIFPFKSHDTVLLIKLKHPAYFLLLPQPQLSQ